MKTHITTKFKINTPVDKVFEAFVSPSEIGHFWFSSSSERWSKGKTITLKYDEYNAEGTIHVLEFEVDQKIVFSWGEKNGQETIVTITFAKEDSSTTIEVIESGFNENDPNIIEKMIGQKGGWVYALTCLKGYLENGANNLRASMMQ